jgi:DNA/RNA-binding domain of Phe-tRNA-synthetase-like protein
MISVKIDSSISSITPEFHMAIMTCDVLVKESKDLDVRIQDIEKEISSTIDIKDVVNLDVIIDGRNAYKAYGKDPSRYRLAVESLYRRLSKGQSLYRINNIVDIGNLLSILTRKSVAVLDRDQIQGDIVVRLGSSDDQYFGIGRGKINVTNIPLYEDTIGPFGSVTSDTERTMIRPTTKRILVFIISFSGKEVLEEDLQKAIDLYQTYGFATNIDSTIL